MKKLFLISPALFTLLILGSVTLYAQDSAKAKTTQPIAKPLYAKPGAAKYPVRTYQAKPTTQVPPVTNAANTTPGAQSAAQPPVETPASTDKSLAGQYQYVLSKTYRYQQPMIAALWKNITDSLNATKKALRDVQAKLNTQNQSISNLQNDVKTKEQNITESNARRDEISVLGIYFTKTAYNLMMWGLVIAFGLALLIVILRTGGAVREAKYRTKLYDELNDEFTAYKAKANEKEKKLARELQTERNKVDELMGRG
ncbi:hypothetical protein [Mucilaginibacter boryungensis]|uniref:Uncharacterized protein n=1 Tax=Mucilaginibacter boryungensis TaxID=768480 RepID=A0ABR9XD51_9SPHI|nr:hypothetical protein [Mucilaginibacter boryungensis]MBE9665008.1 hypothetical protein [Mucilaginibacter boryungensis]